MPPVPVPRPDPGSGGASLPAAGEPHDAANLLAAHLPAVRRAVAFVCRRNHLTVDDSDEFESHVRLKLLEDDAAILRKFAGRSTVYTFLSVVVQRLYLDYRRAAWGTWRPSAQALRLGALAVLIDRLTTRDGHTHDEAYEIVTITHCAALSRGEFDAIVGRLPQRPGRRFVSDAALSELAAPSPGPDQALIDDEAVERERHVQAALRRAMAALPAQDRLVLTMRYLDGRTVAEIAKNLRLDQKVLYRRVDKLLATLRRQLEAAGVGENAAREILEA